MHQAFIYSIDVRFSGGIDDGKLYVRVWLCIKHLVLSFLFSVLNAKFVAIQIIFGEFYRYFQSISVGFCEA